MVTAKVLAKMAAMLICLSQLSFNCRAVTFLTQFSLIQGTCCSIVIMILLKFSSCSYIGVFEDSGNYKNLFDSDLFSSGSPSSNLIKTVNCECWSVTHLQFPMRGLLLQEDLPQWDRVAF